jgi:hypothetical protein
VPPHLQPVAVRDRMVELGVIVRPIAPDTLVLCPPLVITDAELDQVVSAFRTALAWGTAGGRHAAGPGYAVRVPAGAPAGSSKASRATSSPEPPSE